MIKNKIAKEGIVFSSATLIIFYLMSLYTGPEFGDGFDSFSSREGFPLQAIETYECAPTGPDSEFMGLGLCERLMPTNALINLVLGLLIGFGISYTKNKVMKK